MDEEVLTGSRAVLPRVYYHFIAVEREIITFGTLLSRDTVNDP